MNLTVTLVQADLHWEDISANLKDLGAQLTQIASTDLIILPELFSTGFTFNTDVAEPVSSSQALEWMHVQAKKYQAVVTGSLLLEENGNYYNRLAWVQPDGQVAFYDKRHLFSMAREQDHFTSGTQKQIFDYKGWKIRPFICYDLRFPVWNRNQDGYDLAFYVASWPAKRRFHWKSLLTARAIENQAFVVAVNRVGIDGKGFAYAGDSMVLDPIGSSLYHKEEEADVFTITLTKEVLVDRREQFPFLDDRDDFELL